MTSCRQRNVIKSCFLLCHIFGYIRVINIYGWFLKVRKRSNTNCFICSIPFNKLESLLIQSVFLLLPALLNLSSYPYSKGINYKHQINKYDHSKASFHKKTNLFLDRKRIDHIWSTGKEHWHKEYRWLIEQFYAVKVAIDKWTYMTKVSKTNQRHRLKNSDLDSWMVIHKNKEGSVYHSARTVDQKIVKSFRVEKSHVAIVAPEFLHILWIT